jgi:hypothetical protein
MIFFQRNVTKLLLLLPTRKSGNVLRLAHFAKKKAVALRSLERETPAPGDVTP